MLVAKHKRYGHRRKYVFCTVHDRDRFAEQVHEVFQVSAVPSSATACFMDSEQLDQIENYMACAGVEFVGHEEFWRTRLGPEEASDETYSLRA